MNVNMDQMSYEEFAYYADMVKSLTEEWAQTSMKIMNAEKEYGLGGHIADENMIPDDEEEDV